jgi:hypothetical protein
MSRRLLRQAVVGAIILAGAIVAPAHAAPQPVTVKSVQVVVDSAGSAAVTFRLDCNFDPTLYAFPPSGELDLSQDGRGGYFASYTPICGQPITVHISTEAASLPFIPGGGGHVTIGQALCTLPLEPGGTTCSNKTAIYHKDNVRFKAA